MNAHEDTVCLADPAMSEDRPNRTILIIEDDLQQIEILQYHLQSQGFCTVSTRTGSEGMAVARELRPDLVLLDLRLPDADGLSICERLADGPATATTPVIILSGMARPDIIRCSRAAGCSYYVRKPYDPSALLILIEQAIREANSW
jgi:DNA-binding response OmpR family regulator